MHDSTCNAHLQMFEAIRLQGAFAHRICNGHCVGKASKQLLEQHPDFPACDVCTHAKVRSAGTEALVRIGIACNVELERVREVAWITVCRDKPYSDLLPLFHLDTFEFDVVGQKAAH